MPMTTDPTPLPDIKLQIVGNRFTWDEYPWFDVTDPDTVRMILVKERRDLLWEGRFSVGVEIAVQLRAAGLLTVAPLPVSDYVTKLREFSEEAGEPLPEYIQRLKEALRAF